MMEFGFVCTSLSCLRLCGLHLVSMVVYECRFKVNLACLSLGGLDEAFETTSCLKDRELLYDVYRLARKASRTSPWNQIPQVFQKELNLEVRTMEDFGASKCNNVLGNQLGSTSRQC